MEMGILNVWLNFTIGNIIHQKVNDLEVGQKKGNGGKVVTEVELVQNTAY